MKNKIVEWELKDFNKEAEVPQKEKPLSKKEILAKYDWAKKVKTKNDEDWYEYTPSWKVSKKLIKFFEEKYLRWKNSGYLIGSIPLMLVGFILFFNLFTHSLTREEILDYANPGLPILIFLSLFIYCICYYEELKEKRLYQQVCNWTIKSKEVEIIRFNRYIIDDKIQWPERYRSSNYSVTIYASDWKKDYESDKFYRYTTNTIDYKKYYEEHQNHNILLHSRIYRILRLLRIVKKPRLPSIEYVIINNKKYSIGDKVTVYIDSKWSWNYCIHIPGN